MDTQGRQRRRLLCGVAGAGLAALAGCGGGEPGYVRTDTVDMTDANDFDPARVEVTPGTTVTWENVGSTPHTVTAYDGEIPSPDAYFASGGYDSESAARGGYPDGGVIDGGGSYEHTFETLGVYQYLCIPHETAGMFGRVRVVDPGATSEAGSTSDDASPAELPSTPS